MVPHQLHDDRVLHFMSRPAAPPLDHRPAAKRARARTEIGPYKLVQKLGETGMGVVYLASRSSPSNAECSKRTRTCREPMPALISSAARLEVGSAVGGHGQLPPLL